MVGLLAAPAFWTAVLGLAWPLVALVVFFYLRPILNGLLKHENMTVKVGSFELSIKDATRNIGSNVADIQQRLADVENIIYREHETPSQIHPYDKIAEIARGPKILWVDDYPSNNAFIVENLRSKGIQIDLSLSTSDALIKLDETNYAAIISDLGRIESGNNNPWAGLELIEKLRVRGSHIPVLIFAGKRGMENRRKLIEAGAEAVTASGVDVMSFVEKHIGTA